MNLETFRGDGAIRVRTSGIYRDWQWRGFVTRVLDADDYLLGFTATGDPYRLKEITTAWYIECPTEEQAERGHALMVAAVDRHLLARLMGMHERELWEAVSE